MGKNIFVKSLLISFFIHLCGTFLFSIFLPGLPKRNKPIEVFLYNKLETKKMDVEEKLLIKKIEKNIGEKKITSLNEARSKNISKKNVIGEDREDKAKTNLDLDIEKYQSKTQLANPPSSPIYETLTDQVIEGQSVENAIIEGPVGKRKIIYKEKIEYPLWAQKMGIEGKVKIKFWVNPEGKISDTEIYTSSGFLEIDLYAEENFKKWMFEPTAIDEDVWGIITIVFKLR